MRRGSVGSVMEAVPRIRLKNEGKRAWAQVASCRCRGRRPEPAIRRPKYSESFPRKREPMTTGLSKCPLAVVMGPCLRGDDQGLFTRRRPVLPVTLADIENARRVIA